MADESLDSLHLRLRRAALKRLIELIEGDGDEVGPTSNAQTLNVARQWLKDNFITGDPERPSAADLDLAKALDELDLELPN